MVITLLLGRLFEHQIRSRMQELPEDLFVKTGQAKLGRQGT